MLAADLLLNRASDLPISPENPLEDPSFLQECQVLDVRIDALRSTVGLLLELRTAICISLGVAAVMVARETHEVRWLAGQAAERTAWSVIGAESEVKDGLLEMVLYLSPDASLLIRAASLQFYNLDVAALSERIPDYAEDDESTLRVNLPNWESEVVPLATSLRSSR